VATFRSPSPARLAFVVTAALIAAGIGDPLVETIADTGAFGAGYHDTNHLGVLPALICALGVALEMAVLYGLRAFSAGARHGGERLRSLARRIGTHRARADVPFVFALQLAAVFAIESFEAFAAGGKTVDATSWLGAPPAFSLAVHGALAFGITVALARVARALVATLASLVRVALRFIAVPPLRERPALRDLGDAALLARRLRVRVRETGERAPPVLLASA